MSSSTSANAGYPEIDTFAATSWHFPLNLPKRQYQFEIIQQALHRNTLVALPTGLGKTFIAAVVMFNFYRWFPTGKILFMAPTRPLVAQQLEATLRTVEIDAKVTTEMTGGQSPSQRHDLWKNKRVFFLTPQVLQNDLISGICDCKKLVLLVFDEAHRALGNHAYCDIIRLLGSENNAIQSRILALTATPASSVATVQQVIDNLLISDIAIRTEESMDVKPYVHERTISSIIVPESAEIRFVRQTYEREVLQPYVDKLHLLRAISEKDPSTLSSFQLIRARECLRRRHLQSGAPKSAAGAAEGIFAVLISLYHAYDLLISHGIRAFVHHLTKLPDEAAAIKSRMRHELDSNPSFVQLMAHLDSLMESPQFVSHPKIDIVESTLLHHCSAKNLQSGTTRAIVFSQYRESVFEIVSKLKRHAPILKVMAFVGQSSASGPRLQITQKQQLEVLDQFKSGGYNVLIATCIAEEGLDIGNVDLIICFDMQSSPIRMLQRMGRTGRHRDGTILLLQSAGREEQRYQRTVAQHSLVQKAISNPSGHYQLFQPKFDLLPPNINPLERDFCVDENLLFLDAMKKGIPKGSRKSTSITMNDPISIPTLPTSVLDAVEIPRPGNYLSWEKTSGAFIHVSHSLATERFLELFRTFEEIENQLLCSVGPLKSCGKAVSMENAELGNKNELDDMMQSAIKEMQRFTSQDSCIQTWTDHLALFSSYISHKSPHVKKEASASLAHDPLLLNQEDLSDDFFDDGSKMILDSLDGLAPFESLSLGLGLELRCGNNPAPLSSSHDAISQPRPLNRRGQTGILYTSSVDSSPSESNSSPLPLKRSKFVDIEAGCEDLSFEMNDDDDTASGSLMDFIDDRSQISNHYSNESHGEDKSDPLSSDGMMAFYQRSAFASQPDPRFKTIPKQFALKNKLRLEVLGDSISSSASMENHDLKPFDWSSDLEL